jgi:hypothetical protein
MVQTPVGNTVEKRKKSNSRGRHAEGSDWK